MSPSLAPSELADCRRLAESWGLRWMEVASDEGARPGYVANGPDRCYHCKSELMDRLAPVAAAEGAVVALGVNVDDLGDHRPGQQAARERGAVFPLVEAGLTKAQVREAARQLGLAVWDKPAAACLASRVPYGTPVTLGTLDPGGGRRGSPAGPRASATCGSVTTATWPAWSSDPTTSSGRSADRDQVVAAVRAAGYRYVTLDLEGLRSGNLNDVLAPAGRPALPR